jgi:hypothetical protein
VVLRNAHRDMRMKAHLGLEWNQIAMVLQTALMKIRKVIKKQG